MYNLLATTERVRRVFPSCSVSSASFLLMKDWWLYSYSESWTKSFFPFYYYFYSSFFGKTLSSQIVQASDLFLVSLMRPLPSPKFFPKPWFSSLIYFFASSLWGLLLSLVEGNAYLEVFRNNIWEGYLLILAFAIGLSPFIQMRRCTGSFTQSFWKLHLFTFGT